MKTTWQSRQRTYWETEAYGYDELYLDRWSKLEDEFSTTIISELFEGIDKRRVLDLACGTGLVVSILNALNCKFDYLGIDISESMLQIAKEKYPLQSFEIGNIDNLSESIVPKFNLLIGWNGTLSYSEDPKMLIDKLVSLLPNGSKLAISFYGRWSLSRLVRFRFSAIGDRSTRHSAKTKGSPVRYFSKAEVEELVIGPNTSMTKLIAISAFGRILEWPPIWGIDRILCRLFPNLGHTMVVCLEIKK